MNIILLDTSVASLIYKNDKKYAFLYEQHILENIPSISFQSVAELLSWPIENHWGKKRKAEFFDFIDKLLVISYSFDLAEIWAQVSSYFKTKGRRLEAGDCWIISTAILYNLPLLTHDRDFLGVDYPGLEIITYLEDEKT